MPSNVYTTPSLPLHWVMRSVTGSLWLVPTDPPKGWNLKRPYRGYTQSLKPLPADKAEKAIAHADAHFDLLRKDFWEAVE